MKWLVRLFFRTVRRVLGPFVLLFEKITTPKGVKRAESEQQKLDEATKDFTLYQFRTCPFCLKVRRTIKRQSLNIELRDAQHEPRYRQQLLQGGGQIKVPCLKVKDSNGNEQWLYESKAIIEFLNKQAA